MTGTYTGPERRRAADDLVTVQRTANESLVLAAVRAEDAAESARGGQELAEEATRRLERQTDELRTVRARLELALSDAARLNRELERAAVGQQAARAEAEAANRAKDEFLAMLGHELRNPLAPITTALHLMRLRGATPSREQAIIERQMKYLVRLVDDLLDVSRIASGKVELRRARIELAEIVSVAAEMASPLIERREHRLIVTVPTHGLLLDADAGRLAQVISNLLTNAARYTPPGGAIALVATRRGDAVEVVVSDTGIGIASDMLGHVFDLFAQAKQASDRNEGGLGLGLALVRSLVLLHGGTVEARSEGKGRGTSVVVRLPAASPEDAHPPRETQALSGTAVEQAAERRRILLVDDNVDAAEMLADLLRAKGHEVVTAHDGPDALALLDTVEIDTAILDIGLPVMDGYELASRLRARPGTSDARLIALTGYGQASDRDRALRAGFDAHLVKPVTLRELDRSLTASPPGTLTSA